MGIRRETLRYALYDAIVEGRPVGDIIINDPALPYLDVLPATQDLVGAELEPGRPPRAGDRAAPCLARSKALP